MVRWYSNYVSAVRNAASIADAALGGEAQGIEMTAVVAEETGAEASQPWMLNPFLNIPTSLPWIQV